MKRATLAVVLLAAAVIPQSSAATTPVPTLQVVHRQPLVVAGARFAPGERVAVTVFTALGPRAVRARANSMGSFRATLGAFAQPCGQPFLIRARGLTSARAALTRLAPPPCVPPPIR